MFNLKYYFRVEHSRVKYSRAQYIRESNEVTLAPPLLLIFCTTLSLNIQQPHTLKKVLYPADGDANKVT